jgi:hypothetical protein
MEYEQVVSLIDKGFTELKDEHLKPIKEQVLKTNGSVAELKTWKEQVIGGFKVITFIGFSGLVAWLLLLRETI